MNLGSNPLIPDDKFVRNAVKSAVHVRKHLPLYVIGLAVLLVAVLVPTVALSGGSSGTGTGLTATGGSRSGGSALGGTSAAGTGSPAVSGGGATGAGTGVGATDLGGSSSGGGSSPAVGGQAVAAVEKGTGTTIGGFKCAPGVNQIPWSAYALPCINHFTGYNGGATSRGVTSNTIVIADRDCPQSADSAAVQQFAQQAGAASQATTDAVQAVFINYFNKVFDLYGRHIVFEKTPVSGSSTQCTSEAEYQGQDAACADADNIANSMHAYAEDGLGLYSEGGGPGGSGPFSECAAAQHLVEMEGGAYFSQDWYDKLNPYVWDGTMGCIRIGGISGEFIGKNLVGQPAKWAGDPLLQKEQRVYGVYVPSNPSYTSCTKYSEQVAESYGANPKNVHEFDYVLDVSRFADQASQAIVQFHAEGVTTVVIACDPISPVFLTEEADSQNYFPEWYEIGTALNDFDTIPRLWDAKEITGHLFGLSQLGPSQAIVGPASEPGITYQHITGKPIPQGTAGSYYGLLTIYNMLQAAGPVLTPANMAQGIWALPPGGAPVPGGTKYAYAVGLTCYCTNPRTGKPGEDHTAVEDARYVYWDNTGTSPYDGKTGTYIQLWSGARFTFGNLPRGTPPFYPAACNPSCKTEPPDQAPPPGPHEGG